MKTLVFDGNNSLWRIAKSLPVLTSRNLPVQVVYGFLRLIRTAISDFEPDRVLVCWDKGIPKERQRVYPGYKAHRFEKKRTRSVEERLVYSDTVRQQRIVGDLFGLLCVGQVSIQNLEADDLIAIACKVLPGKKVVVSADRDMLQLVCDGVTVYSPIKGELYTVKNFFKKVGLSPRQYLEMRALIGDSMDGIPGAARGFGEITATELITKYGSIKNLFRGKVQQKVEGRGTRYALLYSDGSEERVHMNLRIMDLDFIKNKEAEEIILKEAEKGRALDKLSLRAFFKKNDFHTLLNDFSVWVRPFENLVQEK